MNIKRMRGRNHRSGGGGGLRHHVGGVPLNRNHVFDSSGPEVRIRGTAQQLFERYLQLGRDAASTGDRVIAESYFQYAEHYFRVLNVINQAAQQSMMPPAQATPRRVQEVDGVDGEEAQVASQETPQPLSEQPGLGEQPEPIERHEIAISAAPPNGYSSSPNE